MVAERVGPLIEADGYRPYEVDLPGGEIDSPGVFRHPKFVFDATKREVSFADEKVVDLSKRESEMLTLLMQHPNQVISRQRFMQEVFGSEFYNEDLVKQYVSYLRKKLGDSREDDVIIEAFIKKGYRFNNPLAPAEDPRYHHLRFDFDSQTGEVVADGKKTHLLPRESDVLLFLMQNPNKVLSVARIQLGVMGTEFYSDSFVRQYVYVLRQKLEDISENEAIIETVKGKGYRFNNPSAPAFDFKYHHLYFDFDREMGKLKVEGEVIKLFPGEREILRTLVANRNLVIPNVRLRSSAVGNLTNGTVKEYICRLRRKIDHGRNLGPVILTLPGLGYVFIDKPRENPA